MFEILWYCFRTFSSFALILASKIKYIYFCFKKWRYYNLAFWIRYTVIHLMIDLILTQFDEKKTATCFIKWCITTEEAEEARLENLANSIISLWQAITAHRLVSWPWNEVVYKKVNKVSYKVILKAQWNMKIHLN